MAAVSLREDYSAAELRRLAAATRNASQSRRLLSLAAVLDGMNREEAARVGGRSQLEAPASNAGWRSWRRVDRQTLRDWA